MDFSQKIAKILFSAIWWKWDSIKSNRKMVPFSLHTWVDTCYSHVRCRVSVSWESVRRCECGPRRHKILLVALTKILFLLNIFFLDTAVTKGRPAGKADSGTFECKKAVPWALAAKLEMLMEKRREEAKASTKKQETAAQEAY